MLHRETRCTCCRLALVSKLLAVPSRHTEASQLAGMSANQ